MERLTDTEKDFAEANHNLVYKFLRNYGYSIEEHYSVAVLGYLKGVQAYNRKEKLKGNYNFSNVAYKYMRAELSNDRKIENANHIPYHYLTASENQDAVIFIVYPKGKGSVFRRFRPFAYRRRRRKG